MSVVETLSDMRARTVRLSAIATIIETFQSSSDRERVISKLEGCGMLSGQVADLLRSTYVAEVAR